jgi:hypothetical protein
VEWTITYTQRSDIPGVEEFFLDYPLDQLTWHKQLALTAEEVAEGLERPDNVVNSYAVYWPQAGRILNKSGDELVNYETGKYCHVFRPKMIAGDGAELWLDQWIDGSSLAIEMPPSAWLDSHVGPWTLDPTFGYTSIGASNAAASTGFLRAFGTFTPGSAGTLTSASIYGAGTAVNAKIGLYDDSSTTPNNLDGYGSGSFSSASPDWRELAANDEAVSTKPYWLGLLSDAQISCRYDSLAGRNYRYNTRAWGDGLADPCGATSSGGTLWYSIYATYAEAGGSILPLIHYHRTCMAG